MHVLIVTDAYFPSRTSVAVLLYELSQTFINEKVSVSIIVPSATQIIPIIFIEQDGCEIISVKALPTKDLNYVRRTLNEFMNPWMIWHTLRRSSQFSQLNIDGVIWYSPSIFWGPLVKRLKQYFQCRSYLILRDIFPDWALHIGILKKGPTYFFLKMIESYQYRQANTIGIQSPNSLTYFQKNHPNIRVKIEVLWNWTRSSNSVSEIEGSTKIDLSAIAGRTIFVYLGNIGVSQGIQTFIRLIERLKDNSEIGFLIVGRGSKAVSLREVINQKKIHNAIFYDEIAPSEIPELLKQCDVGLVFLDRLHQTHNIPGKLITYLESGLAVLAMVNPGNDLLRIIPEYAVGEVYDGEDDDIIIQKLLTLKNLVNSNKNLKTQAKSLIKDLFNSKLIVHQILVALDASKN